jgi:hypothetical protein
MAPLLFPRASASSHRSCHPDQRQPDSPRMTRWQRSSPSDWAAAGEELSETERSSCISEPIGESLGMSGIVKCEVFEIPGESRQRFSNGFGIAGAMVGGSKAERPLQCQDNGIKLRWSCKYSLISWNRSTMKILLWFAEEWSIEMNANSLRIRLNDDRPANWRRNCTLSIT